MKLISIIILLALLSACELGEEAKVLNENLSAKKIWVYVQFNVPAEDEAIESYYYYGRISESLFEKISRDQIKSGFIFLENVKYWGDDDLIHDYESLETTGDIVFRIEDVRRMNLMQKEPLTGMGYEQFEEASNEKVANQQEQSSSSTVVINPSDTGSGSNAIE